MTTPTQDTRDRVIALETELKHVRSELSDVHSKVNEMHSLLLKAQGAKWLLLMLVALGGFIAAKLSPLIGHILPPK